MSGDDKKTNGLHSKLSNFLEHVDDRLSNFLSKLDDSTFESFILELEKEPLEKILKFKSLSRRFYKLNDNSLKVSVK